MSEEICRILSASLAPYAIDGEGKFTTSKFAEEVEFLETPVPFTAGEDLIDACYVGENPDFNILAFRGTALGTDGETEQAVRDWFNNFMAKPVAVAGIPGMLHEGFSGSVERLWDAKFQDEVEKRLNANTKPLLVTGYSKGAALAPIAAAFLKERNALPPDRMAIRIFEPPRPGDVKFAKYVDDTFPGTLAYAYQDDIVPHVPPVRYVSGLLAGIPFLGKILEKYEDIDEWHYKSVGRLRFINWDNEIVDGSPELAIERMAHLVGLVAKGNALKMGSDHMPCGHIYDVLCGRECPEKLV